MASWLQRLPGMRRPREWFRAAAAPARALAIEVRSAGPAGWSPVTIVSGRPMVQLSADVDVVNAGDQTVLLVAARLRKPATTGLVRMRDRAGSRALEPFATARASVFFFVSQAPPPAGTTVVTDVGLVDQFGQEHWCEKVRFRSVDAGATPP